MYQTLLILHSVFRWLVLFSLLFALAFAYRGYRLRLPFRALDNAVRHWTATIAHLQLLLGMVLYFQSPVIRYVLSGKDDLPGLDEPRFFAWLHAGCMLLAVVLVTLGSALAKRQQDGTAKFRVMFRWFLAALILILVAIPWPFSPFAQRAYLRLH